MAFCPNCGTPNTDQAEKCVSCGFELAPKQKAKFKGTIMMSGIQPPVARPPAGPAGQPPAQQPAAPQQPQAPQPAPQRNMAFEKTMLGGPGLVVPPPSATPSQPAANDLAQAPTVEGPAPQFSAAPSQPSSNAPAAPASGYGGVGSTGFGGASGTTGGFGNTGGFSNTGSFGDSLAPSTPKPNTNKVLAIGCAVVLVMTCVIAGVLYSIAKQRLTHLFGSEQEDASALAWRGTLTQALTQVVAICQSDCAGAANYFHPNLQGELLPQAKLLTEEKLQKLADPAQSEAHMLNTTQEGLIATNLNLDPQRCVRLVSGSAKVVACSVPNPAGEEDLRIVHMSGVESL
jgi:hypothetical protein